MKAGIQLATFDAGAQVFNTPEVVKVYVGSFNSGHANPNQVPNPLGAMLFEKEQAVCFPAAPFPVPKAPSLSFHAAEAGMRLEAAG